MGQNDNYKLHLPSNDSPPQAKENKYYQSLIQPQYDKLGFYYNIVDNIKFGPFIDRSTKTDWDNHTETVIGTNFIMEL